MKRFSQGGDSPEPKIKLLTDTDSELSSDEHYDLLSFSATPDNFTFGYFPSQSSSKTTPSQNSIFTRQFSDISPPSTQHVTSPFSPGHDMNDISSHSDIPDHPEGGWFDDINSSPEDLDDQSAVFNYEANFFSALDNFVTIDGASKVATKILENEEIRKEIIKQIYSTSHKSLKNSLKKSKLVSDRKDRRFLTTLTPHLLCNEFHDNSSDSFQLLTQGLLGITNQEDIFASQFLMNNIALLYSTIGKILDRRAIGYSLLLTTMARDGGLREDSLRLFSDMVHPRTSQKYDKSVLALGWNSKLQASLKEERNHFDDQKRAENKLEQLLQSEAPPEAVKAAENELDKLLDNSPPQMQLVWDNMNLRTGHRFDRVGDSYSETNLDWMASLWIKDRIDANHMAHGGIALKDVESLCIKDMLPSDKEKDYIFIALVHYFSSRLVDRHPILFQSIVNSIKPNRPHQFQQAMDKKSQEYTGKLFTKSESRTEDLISMMSEVQLNVNTFEDSEGVEHCYEKKIVSGDNKTEKNMHYGILRFQMQ